MEYQRIGQKIFIRLDPQDEILAKTKEVVEAEGVTLATVSGIGAISALTVGVFRPKDKKYESNHFEGDYEIVSLTGTVSTMNGAPYLHFHMSAGNDQGAVFGGHLNEAIISATGEVVLDVVEGTVERAYSEEINLNLFKFVEQV